jgi:hypothetical protein
MIVERKVQAGTAGAGVGVTIAALALWLVDRYVYTPGTVGDVPDALSAGVTVLVAAVVAYAAGWLARHTPRPDLGES